MDHHREIKNQLTWHDEGKYEVEVVNGKIKKLNFSGPGIGPDTTQSLTSTDMKFLEAVYKNLGELFEFLKEENKRLGYRYATDVIDEKEVTSYH